MWTARLFRSFSCLFGETRIVGRILLAHVCSWSNACSLGSKETTIAAGSLQGTVQNRMSKLTPYVTDKTIMLCLILQPPTALGRWFQQFRKFLRQYKVARKWAMNEWMTDIVSESSKQSINQQPINLSIYQMQGTQCNKTIYAPHHGNQWEVLIWPSINHLTQMLNAKKLCRTFLH
jgi:hypothetical protein